MYASLADVNTHLPQDKLPMRSDEQDLFALDADRIIRGYVGGVIDITVLNTWADPNTTPELIRAIAGRLMAAAFYAERYAENTNEISVYAQSLYNAAIGDLIAIQNGTMTIVDDGGTTIVVTTGGLDNTMFAPNDATVPGPSFTRAQIFG